MKFNTTTFIVVLLIVAVVGWVFYIASVAPKVTAKKQEVPQVSTIPLDDSSAVSAGIIGVWQSMDDAKFVREFKADGTASDSYDTKAPTSDTWTVFTAATPLTVPFPLEAGAVYVQLTSVGDTKETLNFKVSKLTSTELELIYMDRGGALRFTRVGSSGSSPR